MRSVKTGKGHHASLVGIALALMLTGAVARAQQAQQQALPAPSQGQHPAAQASQTEQAPVEAETLHVLVRRPLVVSSPARITRISVADPSIIDTVLMNSNQVLINGKAPGGVSLVVWDETGQKQEFTVYVDLDSHGMADPVRALFPDLPVRAQAGKGKTAWLSWIVIASIGLLTAVIAGARRQREPHLGKLDLETLRIGSPDGYNEPDMAVAPQNSRAQPSPVKETITDDLTGLETPGYFREELDREWRRSSRASRQFSLTMMDLDRFKRVNDRKGRLEGDGVLKAVGALLGARSRQSDVVARYGADEFAILMPETNTLQAEILAERLRAAVEANALLRAQEVTASFGIATFPDHGRTPEEMLSAASSGISLAKQCKGNCVRVATLSPKPGNAERNERLMEVYLDAAEKGIFSTAPDGFSHHQHRFEQTKPLWDSITALAFAVEAKGPYTKCHSQAVSRLAARIATQAGLSEAEVEEIRLAGLVHDIGKLDVPEDVVNKPTQLTAEEFEIMKGHSAWGAKILERLNAKDIERIVRHHHERYDGKGYPDGLAGDQIPPGARIVAVAECFDSMVSDLPYKSARTFEDGLDELRRCSGTQFDPKVVTALLDWLQTYDDPHKPQQPEG